MSSLILFNKPYQVLCQFTEDNGRSNLSEYITTPKYYPAGRLDFDSEGLLLLTNDGNLQHYISHPSYKLPKTYWVQVEGAINLDAIKQLQHGVTLKDGLTKPAVVRHITEPQLWDRHPPIRERQSIPTHWLEISITEGRNRQVRRMTASVGLPTLRLIRVAIGNWKLGKLMPGESQMEHFTIPTTAKKKEKRKYPPKPRAKKVRNKSHRDKYGK